MKDIDRICSVICTSAEGVLYVLKKKDFIRKVLHDKTAQKCLEEQILAKANWRALRIEEYIQAVISKKTEEKSNNRKFLAISQSLGEWESSKIPKVSNFISSKPQGPSLEISELAGRKKPNLIPIDKTFFDPNDLKAILKETSVLKLLNPGSHKRNFMILNAVFRQHKKNLGEEHKSRNFSEPNLKKQFDLMAHNEENGEYGRTHKGEYEAKIKESPVQGQKFNPNQQYLILRYPKTHGDPLSQDSDLQKQLIPH